MSLRAAVALMLGMLCVPTGAADEPVPVKGTPTAYPQTIKVAVNGKDVQLNITGVGVRKKIGLNVYAVASYVQHGCGARTADDVVKADAIRMLHLVMQRTVGPDDFIGAFRAAVGKSHPPEKFEAEFALLVEAVGDKEAVKGDQVTILYVPGAGVRMRLADKVDVTIKNADFARALWEVYLGPKPLDETLKKGLVAMLAPN